MMQLDEPDEFVGATGETHTVRELCRRLLTMWGFDWEKYS